MDAALAALVDRVTRRMRKAERVGRTVILRIRYGSGSVTRSVLVGRDPGWSMPMLSD